MTLNSTQHDFTLENAKTLCKAQNLPFFLRETFLRMNVIHEISNRKNAKISTRAYFFHKAFLRGLFVEALI